MLGLLALVSGVMYYTPMAMNVYSPLPAMMSPNQARVHVEGRIVDIEGLPVGGVEVTLFATDELVTDVVYTNDDGHFLSNLRFDVGQVITVSVNGTLLREGGAMPFVEYDVQEDWGPFWLGTFVIEG